MKAKVNEFLNSETMWWNIDKLNSFIDPEDVEIIKTIRPSITGASDSTFWIHTKDGQYSAKSGYKLLRNTNVQRNIPNILTEACSTIWKLDTPPKIKHVWWKVAHNSISTAENLRKRKMVADSTCQLCGKHQETTNHLIFQCRASKEIWSMTPSIQISGDNLLSNSLIENVSMLLTLNNNQRKEAHIFPFIGWRIWKMRNDLIFNGKRKPIPDVINQALVDYNVWKNTSEENELQVVPPESSNTMALEKYDSIDDIITQTNTLSCFVDGSWTSPTDNAGIGWAPFNTDGRIILEGKAAIEPVNSPLDAEAEALRMAVVQMRKLGYHIVTFYGDSSEIYDTLSNSHQASPSSIKGNHCPTYMKDIANLAKESNYNLGFQKVKRTCNGVAYKLAKEGRITNSGYVVRWKNNV